VAILTPTRATGSHFYKYSSPDHLERLENIALKHSLYFPTLGELNDPADAKPRLAPLPPEKLAAHVYDNLIKSNPGLSLADRRHKAVEITCDAHLRPYRLLRELARKLYAHMNRTHRVYCLSKHYDNLVMWAKYAGNHSGYCLEFANEGPFFTCAFDVAYVDELPFMDITDPEDRGPYIFFKHSRWSGEEEVRVGGLNLDGNPMVSFDSHCLRRIILGPRMSAENEKTIREWADRREPKLDVVKAYFDDFDLKMKLPLSSPYRRIKIITPHSPTP